MVIWPKVKVKLGSLCAKPFGNHIDCRFSPIAFKCHISIVYAERRNPIDFGPRGKKVKVNFGFLCIKCLDTIRTTGLAQSRSNFTCKLWIMRVGRIYILGCGVKCQGLFWHFVYKTFWTRYKLHFYSNHFQTSHVSYALIL